MAASGRQVSRVERGCVRMGVSLSVRVWVVAAGPVPRVEGTARGVGGHGAGVGMVRRVWAHSAQSARVAQMGEWRGYPEWVVECRAGGEEVSC